MAFKGLCNSAAAGKGKVLQYVACAHIVCRREEHRQRGLWMEGEWSVWEASSQTPNNPGLQTKSTFYIPGLQLNGNSASAFFQTIYCLEFCKMSKRSSCIASLCDLLVFILFSEDRVTGTLQVSIQMTLPGMEKLNYSLELCHIQK